MGHPNGAAAIGQQVLRLAKDDKQKQTQIPFGRMTNQEG